jgi:cell division protein FtsL
MKTALKKERVERYGAKKNARTKSSPKKRARVNIVKVSTILAFFGVFISSFLFYTWVHMQVVHISYELAQAKTLESEYLQVNKKLKTEIATLKTPLRIKQLAKAKLGLNTPEKDQVIILK